MNDSSKPENRSFGALLQIALLCAAGAGLRLCLSEAMRHRSDAAPFWGFLAAAAAGAAGVLWVFVRLMRRREDWPLYLGASLLFILLYKAGKYRPEIASVELPLALFSLVPAAMLLAAFTGRVRRADELERRILGKAFAAAFAVAFAVMLLYAFGEGLGLPHASAIWWAALLLASWSVGLAVSARRYE